MSKLILIITHGMGDWYLPLSCLPYWKNQFLCEDYFIWVDSIYFVDPNKYCNEVETATVLLNSMYKGKWNSIPANYFGSGDYIGIKDRYNGPQYNEIKNKFLFYRGDNLREFVINNIVNDKDYVITGCNKHSYLWKDNTNVPLSFDYREPLKIKTTTYIPTNNTVLIHVRTRGNSVLGKQYQEIINKCNSLNMNVYLIGLKSEYKLINYTEDFREVIDTGEIFRLIEQCNWFIGNNSMYTIHRMMFNKPTISFIAEHNGKKESFFTDRELNNKNYHIFNSDCFNIQEVFNVIESWKM